MEYFRFLKDSHNYIYSIDMVRLQFELKERDLERLNNYLNDINRSDINMFGPSFKTCSYKYLYTIQYELSSMSIGVCFNGYTRDDKFKGFIEFNPNKVLVDCRSFDDLRFISDCCFNISIKRFDLAIDIPESRDRFIMLKDQRIYQLVRKSRYDKTEYLGTRNKSGFIKLYNKTEESGLNYDLTRLEITLEDDIATSQELDRIFPEVYYSDNQSSFLDLTGLTNTEEVLVKCIVDSGQYDYYLGMLESHKKRKLKPYVFQGQTKVEIDHKIVYNLICDIKSFLPLH